MEEEDFPKGSTGAATPRCQGSSRVRPVLPSHRGPTSDNQHTQGPALLHWVFPTSPEERQHFNPTLQMERLRPGGLNRRAGTQTTNYSATSLHTETAREPLAESKVHRRSGVGQGLTAGGEESPKDELEPVQGRGEPCRAPAAQIEAGAPHSSSPAAVSAAPAEPGRES